MNPTAGVASPAGEIQVTPPLQNPVCRGLTCKADPHKKLSQKWELAGSFILNKSKT